MNSDSSKSYMPWAIALRMPSLILWDPFNVAAWMTCIRIEEFQPLPLKREYGIYLIRIKTGIVVPATLTMHHPPNCFGELSADIRPSPIKLYSVNIRVGPVHCMIFL